VPLILVFDICSLSLSVVFSFGLVLIVGGAGMRRPPNRNFVFFALAQAAWAATSLLMRLLLWFSSGRPELMLDLATVSFALMGPSLLLFAARYMRLRGGWPTWTSLALSAGIVAHLAPLLAGKLVSAPVLDPSGVVLYSITPWGIAASILPCACILLALGLFILNRPRGGAPFFSISILFLISGFVVGGLIQLRVPVMSITNTVSVSVLGWGIMRRQLFNPLRDLAADLRERAHRQELISQISRRTATLLELDELLLQAVALIRASFEYFTVGILLVDGEYLVLRASTLPAVQAYSKRFRLKIGAEGICGHVAATGVPLRVSDVRREPRYIELSRDVRTLSELAVPIMRGERVIGVLDVQSSQPAAFSDDDIETQQTIADQLSSAIENARLYEETRRRAERLALVNRISSAAGSVLNLNDLLETVYREVTPIFEADAFFIALYDPRENVLDFRIQVDEGSREPQMREPLGSGLTSRVVTERKPLLVHDLEGKAPDGLQPEAWGSGKMPSSWIGVPMLIAERMIGVLSVQTYRPRPYDEEDLLLAATIADQVAVAVENARLYEEVRQELDVRTRTENGLRESEEKFRNLAEQSPNMIFIWRQGGVVYANRQCELTTGYTREEFYSPRFDFLSLTATGSRAVVAENFRRHLAGDEVPPYEYSLLTREGRRIDAILTTKLMRYENAPAILGIVTDITTRKHTERLLQSLNTAALAMEQALTPAEILPIGARMLAALGLDSAVFLADADDQRTLTPRCWGSGVNGEVHTMEGEQGTAVSIGVDDIPAVSAAMSGRRAVFTSLEPGVMDSILPSTGGQPWPGRPASPQLAILAPLVASEQVIGLIVVSGGVLGPEDEQVFTAFAHQAAAAWRKTRLMQDLEGSLAQLRQTQEQLLHAQKMEAIGRLAGGIAHDFNNILTVISGYTSLLVDALEGNAPALGDLNQIRNTIKRASALTSRLLAFSRKQILQPSILDMNKVVANSVTLLRPLIGEDIELVARLTQFSVCVRADHYQMEQVLMNLAVNARDAMPGGGRLVLETAGMEMGKDGTPAFSGSVRDFEAGIPPDLPPGPWVVLRVQDSGVGMSEDTRSHLFEPFFTTKDEGKGSGLGLSTVYGIVSQSGGRVGVESALGRGTVFTVYLPRVQPRGEQATMEDALPSPRTGSGTVLLVEDEADVRELARRVLEKAGPGDPRLIGTGSAPGCRRLGGDRRGGHRRGDAGRHERRGDGRAPFAVPAVPAGALHVRLHRRYPLPGRSLLREASFPGKALPSLPAPGARAGDAQKALNRVPSAGG
jgi:PAS domain S-box-containing protein